MENYKPESISFETAMDLINGSSRETLIDDLDSSDGIDAGDRYGLNPIDHAAIKSLRGKVTNYNDSIVESLENSEGAE